MTDRDDDDQGAADWLAAQFDPTGELPKQAPEPKPEPEKPPVNPAAPAIPGQPVVPVQPLHPAPPVQPPPLRPQQPLQPQMPPAPVLPAPVPPAPVPPAHAPVPPGPVAPAQLPTYPLPPQQTPSFPPAPPTTPAAPPPAYQPPAYQPPAASPPAASPPAASPPAVPPSAVPLPPAQPTAVSPPEPFSRPLAQDPAPLDSAFEGGPSVDAEPPVEAMPFETGVLPDVAPGSVEAPPFWEPESTQEMDAVEIAPDPPMRIPQPQPPSVFPPQPPAPEPLPTEVLLGHAAPTDALGLASGDLGGSGIDALFGESQFREYAGGLDPAQNPFVRQAETAANGGIPSTPAAPPGPPPGISRLQRILLIVLGTALALLALVALFFVGMRLPDMLGPSPTVAGPTGTPSPTASPEIALGPVAPGEYRWDELLGGECLDPYQSPWQDSYTVVNCEVAHPAQLVGRGLIVEDILGLDLYPGEDALQSQALEFCGSAGILDSAVAGKISDAVVQASYPTEQVWGEGGRAYFCFVTRSSGDLITGSLALPQVAPEPTAEPTPTPAP